MWHSGSKCQRIGASMKANRKRLKTVLASEVKNISPSFIALELVEFPLFDDFFLDLAKFQDLDVFSLFDFSNLNNFFDFLVYSTPFLSIPNLLTLSSPLFFLEAGLLLLFLLEADLLPLFLLKAGLLVDLVVFSIEMSRVAILLKL